MKRSERTQVRRLWNAALSVYDFREIDFGGYFGADRLANVREAVTSRQKPILAMLDRLSLNLAEWQPTITHLVEFLRRWEAYQLPKLPTHTASAIQAEQELRQWAAEADSLCTAAMLDYGWVLSDFDEEAVADGELEADAL